MERSYSAKTKKGKSSRHSDFTDHMIVIHQVLEPRNVL
jgi:hypothetical protein